MFELSDDPTNVYKMYRTPIPDAVQSFAAVVQAGQKLSPELEQKGIVTSWPTIVCGFDNAVHGYFMPRIPQKFNIDLRTPYGNKSTSATLDHALSASDRSFSPTQPLTSAERLQLLRLVAIFLDTLHRNDLLYGDISLKNMMFSRSPMALLVIDMDSVRPISAAPIPEKDFIHTPDWKDPFSDDQISLGFDLDRYKFALLAYRLLVADSVSKPLPADENAVALESSGKGLNSHIVFLLSRAAAGKVGTRPLLSEWLRALSPC